MIVTFLEAINIWDMDKKLELKLMNIYIGNAWDFQVWSIHQLFVHPFQEIKLLTCQLQEQMQMDVGLLILSSQTLDSKVKDNVLKLEIQFWLDMFQLVFI